MFEIIETGIGICINGRCHVIAWPWIGVMLIISIGILALFLGRRK
jgi:hypothetical protein